MLLYASPIPFLMLMTRLSNPGICKSANEDNESTSLVLKIHLGRNRALAVDCFFVAKHPLVQQAHMQSIRERGKAQLVHASNGHLEWTSSLQPSPVSAPSLGPDRSLTMATKGERDADKPVCTYMTNNASEVRSAFRSLSSHTDHPEGCCRQVALQAWMGEGQRHAFWT